MKGSKNMATSALGEVFIREVTIKVTPEEQNEKMIDLVRVDEEIDKVSGEKAAQAAEHNSLLKDLRKNRSNILSAIKSGLQTRKISVYEKRNDQLGQIETYRSDTNEIIDELTRPMNSSDRQLSLEDAIDTSDADDTDEDPPTEVPEGDEPEEDDEDESGDHETEDDDL
jgi:hypothetical protein